MIHTGQNIIKGFILISNLLIFSPQQSSGVVSYSELETFARQLESSIANGNPYFFNLSLNIDHILTSVVNKNEFRHQETHSEDFIKGIKEEFDLGTVLTELVRNNGRFAYIKASQSDGKSKILFRLASDNGISYHEYHVEEFEGKLTITDGYIFNLARSLSEIFEEIYSQYISAGSENDDAFQIRQLAASARFKKAYKTWAKIPEDKRHTEEYQLLGIQLAEHLDRNIYFAVYLEYLTNFPEEAGKYIIPLNGLLKHGYADEALASINKLDCIIQTDPLLDYLRANIYFSKGDHANAKKALGVLIENMPAFEEGYFSLLNLYIKDKEFGKATELLDKLVLTFNANKEEVLPYLQNHTDFLKSSEYMIWIGN